MERNYSFREIKDYGDFSTRDYISCYYLFPNLNFGYNELISSILNNGNFALNLGSIIMILTGIICGAIGGIMGVNIG